MILTFTPRMLAIERVIPRRYIQRVWNRPGQALAMLLARLGRPLNHRLEDYQRELLDNVPLRETYFTAVRRGWIPKHFSTWEERFGDLYRWGLAIAWYYALIRELTPERVIETGTAAGVTASLMLAALERNGKGELISIDLPAKRGENTMDWSLPEGQSPGFLIPEQYRHRWQLRIGDAKDILVPALRERPCDLFFHDSLHTYEHMMWEYITAFVHMRDDSIIMSDDTFWNRAWWDFTANFGLERFQDLSNPKIGISIVRRKPMPVI